MGIHVAPRFAARRKVSRRIGYFFCSCQSLQKLSIQLFIFSPISIQNVAKIHFCPAVATVNACSNPTLSSTSFTTQDATILTNIAYVSQFKLECDGEAADIPLFAEVGGKPLSVVKSKETNEYQVSWVEETQKAS